MDMRFGIWNIRSLYRAGLLVTVLKEVSRYKLDLVRVREVRWKGGCTEPIGEYTFFYRKGNENHDFGTGFILYIRESCQQLRGLCLLLIGCHTERSLVSYHCSELSCPS
jgi:hypothetical protein